MPYHIKLLGSLAIQTKTQHPSPIMKSQKGIALLTYLIVTQQPQQREAIADLLWNATTTTQALQSLRELLQRMRRWMPDELAITHQTIAFQPHPQTTIDLYLLQEQLDSPQIQQIDKTLTLYQGELLPQFDTPEMPRFQQWLQEQRQQIDQQITTAYQNLCQTYAQNKQSLLGLDLTRRWRDLSPEDQEATYWHLYFLAHSGQSNLAQAHFATLPQPQAQLPKTQRLMQTLQEKTFSPSSVPSSPPSILPSTLPPNSILPYHRYQDFVGRDTLLAGLATTLSSQSVTLIGPIGIGKTQLAIEFAHRYGYLFPDGIYWFTAYQHRKPPHLSNNCLLIFDDYASLDNLPSWWQQAPALITSLGSAWQTAVTVPPLPPHASVTLLQKHRSSINTTTAQAIANHLNHLPLALYLAGQFLARYQQISPEAYLQQITSTPLPNHPSMQGHGVMHSPTNHPLHLTK